MSGNRSDRAEWGWYQSGQRKRKREEKMEPSLGVKMSVFQILQTADIL